LNVTPTALLLRGGLCFVGQVCLARCPALSPYLYNRKNNGGLTGKSEFCPK